MLMGRRVSPKKNKIGLNDSGSTMVMAVIAIAFVAILATVILSASLANINMKRMDSNSKNTFYTAESVLDEVKAGIGYDSINVLGESYTKVLTTLVRQGPSYKYIINNEQANQELKEYFVDGVLSKVTNNELAFDDKTLVTTNNSVKLGQVKDYLNGFIKGYEGEDKTAEVKSIGKITAVKDKDLAKYTVILKDVVIAYKQEKAESNYFSNITVDFNIDFPDLTVNFTGGNTLPGFKEFSLITDGTLLINGNQLNVNASHIYAGEKIAITADTDGNSGIMNVTGNVVTVDGGTANSNIISRGDIVVRGSGNATSALSVAGGDIWCNNLTIDSYISTIGGKRDITKGGTINIDSFSNTYVNDDLNLYGKYSSATIGGNFYGYSYDGSAVNSHTASSSVIISGEYSLLNFNLNRLIVGGRSYVVIPGSATGNYMTGESLSVTEDQDLYLVQSKYISTNPSNPMAYATWESIKNDAGANVINTTGFFAADLLNPTTPYVEKRSGNTLYIYYNFKDKASATEYIKRIINGADAELKGILNSYASKVFTGSSSPAGVSITAGQLYTAGTLMQTSSLSAFAGVGSNQSGQMNDISYASGTNSIGNDVFVLNALNCKNRYDIITHLLVDIPATKNGAEYIVDNSDAALKEFYDNYEASGSEMSNDASSNIINYNLLDSGIQYNKDEQLIMYDSGYIKLAINRASYVVPNNVKGGIIVCTGSVILNHDFKGLIICKEGIQITNNATVTTDVALIENLIINEYAFADGTVIDPEDATTKRFKEFFYAYASSAPDDESSEALRIENISYTDIVGCTNWRKYDDGE